MYEIVAVIIHGTFWQIWDERVVGGVMESWRRIEVENV